MKTLTNEGGTSALIAEPTVAEMIDLLTVIAVTHGPDAKVEIKPIANMLGSFVVRVVQP